LAPHIDCSYFNSGSIFPDYLADTAHAPYLVTLERTKYSGCLLCVITVPGIPATILSMSTSPLTIEKILSAVSAAGPVRARAMFGEYALYCDDKLVGLICDDALFMKITAISDGFLDMTQAAKPYPGAKDCLKVPDDMLADRAWISRFVRETADSLPAPKPKKR
jgi:TfoX/Sxy family transcriptional regulator of competence genes